VTTVAATSLLVHALLLFALRGPRAVVAGGPRHPETATIAGVGGVYAIDTECMTGVAVSALARWAACAVLPDARGPASCRDRALSGYRIASIGCRSLERVELAEAELDATELVDDLELLPPAERTEAEAAEDPTLAGQVVELPDVASAPPDDAAFLAERDMKVEQQAVRHGDPSQPLAGPPAPPALTRAAEPAPEPALPPAEPRPALAPPSSASLPRAGGALSMRPPGEGTGEVGGPRGGAALDLPPSTSGLGLARGALPAQAGSAPGAGGDAEVAGPAGEPAAAARSALDLAAMARSVTRGTGGSNDYLPGIDEGEFTALNAHRWKYATFFNRVKRDVARQWNPERAYRLRDPTGNVYGYKDRLTVLQISLKPDGSLHEVVVAGPSGVDFLDDEAIKAFELAQPFANPPGGLVDASSHLITFQFGFAFEIDREPTWRVFRY
jgi:TonB family protein